MRKKVALVGLLTLVAAVTASCGKKNTTVTSGEVSGGTTGDGPEITLPEDQYLTVDYTSAEGVQAEAGAYLAVVAKNMDSGFWTAVKEGAAKAIDDINEILGYTEDEEVRMTFEGTDGDSDIDLQINTIDAVLAENPSALCLAALDMKSCQPQLENAQENGIPVIILDSGVESDLAVCACITDNLSASAEAARKLCQAVGEEGQVAVIAHVQSSETSVDRVAGFRREVAGNHPQVQLAEVVYENEEESVSEMILNLLEAYPDLKGVFCTNESMTEATLGTLQQLGRKDIIIIGFDAGETQIKAIREGREYGTICQNPYGMGYASVIAAFRAAAHQTIDTYIDPGYQWIDARNIDAEENQKYLYQ